MPKLIEWKLRCSACNASTKADDRRRRVRVGSRQVEVCMACEQQYRTAGTFRRSMESERAERRERLAKAMKDSPTVVAAAKKAGVPLRWAYVETARWREGR